MERGDSRREFFKRHPDYAEDDIPLSETIHELESDIPRKTLGHLVMQKGGSLPYIRRREKSKERSKRYSHHYQETEASSGNESPSDLNLEKLNAGDFRSKYNPQDIPDDIPPLKLRGNIHDEGPLSFGKYNPLGHEVFQHCNFKSVININRLPIDKDRSSEHWSLRNAKALTNLKVRGQDVSARRHRLPVPCPTFEEVRNISHRDCETATKLESINMKNMLFFPSKSLTRLSVEEIYAPKMRKAPFRRSVSNLCPSRRGILPRESQIEKEKSSTTSLIQKDTLPEKQSDENMNVPKLMPTIIAKNISEAKLGRVRRQLPTVGPKPFVAAGCGKGIPELSCLPRPHIGRLPMKAIFPRIGDVPVSAEPADSVPAEQEPDIPDEPDRTGRLVNLNDFHTFDENLKPAFPFTTINIPSIDDLPANGTRNLGTRKQRITGNLQTKPNTTRNPREMRRVQQNQRFLEEDQSNYDEDFEQEELEDDNYHEAPENSGYTTIPQQEILPEIMKLLLDVRARKLKNLNSGRPLNRYRDPENPTIEDFYDIIKGPSHDPREQPTVLDAEKVLFMMIRAGQCRVRAEIIPDDDEKSEEDNPAVAHVEENEQVKQTLKKAVNSKSSVITPTSRKPTIATIPDDDEESPDEDNLPGDLVGESKQVKQTPKKAVNFKSSHSMPSNRKQTVPAAPDGNEESPDEDNPSEFQVEENKQVKQTPKRGVNFKSAHPMLISRKQTVPTIPEETSEIVEKRPIKAPPKTTNKPRRVWGELPDVLKKRNDALRTKPVVESKNKLPVEKEQPKRPKTNPRWAHVQCKVPKLRAPTINEMEAELQRNYEEIEKLKKTIEIIGTEENPSNRQESTKDVTNIEHNEGDDTVHVSPEPTETPEIPVELPPVPEQVTELKDDDIPNSDDSDSDSSSIHTELSYDGDEEEFSNSLLCPWSESNVIEDNTIEEKRFESIGNEDEEESKQTQRSRKSTKLENTPSYQNYEINREECESKKPDSSDFSGSKSERTPSSRKDTSKRSTTKNNIKAEHEPGILSVKTTSSENELHRKGDFKSRDESSIFENSNSNVQIRKTANPEGGKMDDDRYSTQDMSTYSTSIHGSSTASSYKTAEEETSNTSEYRDALKTSSESTSESDVTFTPENVDIIKARKYKKSANKHHENLESDSPSSSKKVVEDGPQKADKLVNNYLSDYVDKFNDNLERTAVHIKYGETIPCSCDKNATEPCVKHVDRSRLEFYRETVEIMGFYSSPEEDEQEYCTAEDLIRQFCPDFYVQYVLENPHHPSESFYTKNIASRQNIIKSFKRVLLEEDVLLKYKKLKVNIGNRRNIHLKGDEEDFDLAIEFIKEEYPGLYIHLVQANEFLQLAVEKISVNDNRRDLIKKSKMNIEELAELNKKYGTI